MRRFLACLTLLAGLGTAAAQAPALVTVDNATYPTRCAEEDNVFLTFSAERLSRLRIEARHPAYIERVVRDSYDPDFANCDFGPTPPPEGPFFTPRQFVMWENDTWVMVGNTDRHFWRKKNVPVRLGDRVENDVHLIQFYRKRADGRRDQVLVLYPVDGHWRTKPLPMPHLDYNVYGASFLLGPLEAENRRKPYVDYTEVSFDPATLTFRFGFVRGGGGTVRVLDVTREQTAVEVTFDAATPMDRPFAAMRSMFVEPDNADIGEVHWRDATGTERRLLIKDFGRDRALDVRFARTVISRHNTSAPDMVYREFVGR